MELTGASREGRPLPLNGLRFAPPGDTLEASAREASDALALRGTEGRSLASLVEEADRAARMGTLDDAAAYRLFDRLAVREADRDDSSPPVRAAAADWAADYRP